MEKNVDKNVAFLSNCSSLNQRLEKIYAEIYKNSFNKNYVFFLLKNPSENILN